MKSRADRIAYVRKIILGLKSQEEFGKLLGVSRGAVGNWELNGPIGLDNLMKIQELSGATPQWIENGVGDAPQLNQRQEKNYAATPSLEVERSRVNDRVVLEYDLRAGASYGGGYALPGDNHDGRAQELVKAEWVFPESWLRGEMRLSYRSTDVITVDGPSMLPDLAPGDRVLIDRSNRDCKQDAIFAIRDGDSVIIKHVQLLRNTEPPRIICRSSNENYEPFELVLDGSNVEIIGRVAAKISRM